MWSLASQLLRNSKILGRALKTPPPVPGVARAGTVKNYFNTFAKEAGASTLNDANLYAGAGVDTPVYLDSSLVRSLFSPHTFLRKDLSPMVHALVASEYGAEPIVQSGIDRHFNSGGDVIHSHPMSIAAAQERQRQRFINDLHGRDEAMTYLTSAIGLIPHPIAQAIVGANLAYNLTKKQPEEMTRDELRRANPVRNAVFEGIASGEIPVDQLNQFSYHFSPDEIQKMRNDYDQQNEWNTYGD